MAENNLPISHDGFTERIEKIELEINIKSGAENVAYNLRVSNPCSVAVAGWLKSDGHRENIEGDFDLTGVGISQASDGGYYFTQIFIKLKDQEGEILYNAFVIEEEIFTIINTYRIENNLEQLVWNELIAEQARFNSFKLTDSTINNSEVFDIIIQNIEERIEILRISENISFNSGYQEPSIIAIKDWLDNPDNRDNILGDFNLTGIGVFIDKKKYIYITQIFLKSS